MFVTCKPNHRPHPHYYGFCGKNPTVLTFRNINLKQQTENVNREYRRGKEKAREIEGGRERETEIHEPILQPMKLPKLKIAKMICYNGHKRICLFYFILFCDVVPNRFIKRILWKLNEVFPLILLSSLFNLGLNSNDKNVTFV